LGLHIGFALDAGKRLGHPLVTEHRGSFLLGCTTPDIRLFAGWERERTHFFKLATDPVGAGVEGLLQAHPQLRRSEALSRQTVAFVLGYVSHLTCDETWIVDVYRRFFGPGSPLAADPMVSVLDRAFQFELDRRERSAIEDLEGALQAIAGASAGVEVGFIDGELLSRWQEVVVNRSGRELPWERFRGFVRRVRPRATDEEVEGIVVTAPALIERVRAHIDEAAVRLFRQRSIERFVAAAGRYLSEGQVS